MITSHQCALIVFAFSRILTAQAPTPVPIGSTIDARFMDLRWQQRELRELGSKAAVVVYFATVDCPIVARTMPAIDELARDYAARSVAVVVMNVGVGDAFVEAAAQVVEQAPLAVFGQDQDLSFARACGVDRTNQVVVLDRNYVLSYRGRIDDRHSYASTREQASRADLRLALDEVLAGKPVRIAATDAPGCRITPAMPLDKDKVPTYLGQIRPIMTRHCMPCHSHDAGTQLALGSEIDTRKHAAMIAEVVGNGRMPPWSAASTPVPFLNQRGLGIAEREMFRAWLEAGMPRGASGRPSDHPMHLDWRVGSVDVVLDAAEPVRVPASDSLPYQYIVLPHRFEADTWVEALDIRSTQPRALRHCNLAIVNGHEYEPRACVTNYTPHGVALECVVGTALRIPAGSALALQAFYAPIGREVVDRIQVGLRYPRVLVQQEVRVSTFGNDQIEIPAGSPAHAVEASWTVPVDATGISLFVHMHRRGRDVRVVAEREGAASCALLRIPAYDFGMQESYLWPRAAQSFDKGTQIRVLAHFDNSVWNHGNPDATQVVRCGPGTADEQLQLSLLWIARGKLLRIAVDPRNGAQVVAERAQSKAK